MSTESRIRSFLANNLDFLEPDTHLKLIKEEFVLRNSFGAGGKVDILAKDVYKNYVVIEIKKSNSTAREAAHEILKYVELIKQDLAINPDKIHCILASSEWHELSSTFFRLKKDCDFHIDGIHLTLDPLSGIPVNKEYVTEIPVHESKSIFPEYKLCSYETNELRASSALFIESQIKDFGVKDFIILHANYNGENQKLIYPYPYPYPYASCIVLYEFSSAEVIDILKRLNVLLGNGSYDDILLSAEEHSADIRELQVEKDILEVLPAPLVESCNPTKFHSMLQSGWEIDSISCYGLAEKIKTRNVKSDHDLIEEIEGLDGYNSDKFFGSSNSRFRNSWMSFIRSIEFFLNFNELWREGCKGLLEEYSNNYQEVIVSARIYDRGYLLETLLFTAWTDKNFLPKLELIIRIPEIKKLIILTGFLEWDRRSRPNIDDIIDGDSSDFFIMDHYRKEDNLYNLLMLSKHGIEYSLLECSYHFEESGFHSISLEELEDGTYSIKKSSYDCQSLNSLRDFTVGNEEYLFDLKSSFLEGNYFPFSFGKVINRRNFENYPLIYFPWKIFE